MTLNIVVLPGDGIGPEVTDEAVRVLDWFVQKRGIPLRMERRLFGSAAWAAEGTTMPDATWDAILAADYVVDVGPGSFTGVRVGVTFAKVLAGETGAELAAVSSFDLVDPHRRRLELAEVEEHHLERQVLGPPERVIGAPADVAILVVIQVRQIVGEIRTIRGIGTGGQFLGAPHHGGKGEFARCAFNRGRLHHAGLVSRPHASGDRKGQTQG